MAARKHHCRINPFNLIEVVIALGVVAVGTVSLMALFPVGATASRDAIAETYAAEAAEQVLMYVRNNLHNDWSGTLGTIPIAKPAADYNVIGTVLAGTNGTMFQLSNGKFCIYRYADFDGSGTYNAGDVLDMKAIMIVWQTPVYVNGTAISTSIAIGLNAEIYWPAALNRSPTLCSTEHFYLEVYNRNP
jgi:type II secretory pathway pseudopilin PulG